MDRIAWSDRATQNLEEIGRYIAQDSPQNAARTITEIYHSVERLRQFPQSGRRVPELQTTMLREIIIGNFRVIYTHKDENIIIITVLHSKRNVKRLLRKT